LDNSVYHLAFEGYWRTPDVDSLPECSGIYCVYACTYNAILNSLDIKRLLYVGEADTLRARVCEHECWTKWRLALYRGEELCFTAAPIADSCNRERVEAALINHHQPPCNTAFKDSFPFSPTMVGSSGEAALLSPIFLVSDETNLERRLSRRLWAVR
jgi:excinuclease UvrABC nuclease subunit